MIRNWMLSVNSEKVNNLPCVFGVTSSVKSKRTNSGKLIGPDGKLAHTALNRQQLPIYISTQWGPLMYACQWTGSGKGLAASSVSLLEPIVPFGKPKIQLQTFRDMETLSASLAVCEGTAPVDSSRYEDICVWRVYVYKRSIRYLVAWFIAYLLLFGLFIWGVPFLFGLSIIFDGDDDFSLCRQIWDMGIWNIPCHTHVVVLNCYFRCDYFTNIGLCLWFLCMVISLQMG